jgi:4-hydroxybenzoate polyprenyltransferase
MKFILDSNFFALHFESILVFSGFAFVVNLAREIIKDIQDMEGDKLREIKSFALVFSAGSARKITAFVLLLLIPLYIIGYSIHAFSFILWFNVLFIGAYAMGLLGLILLLFQASEKTINTVLKLSLVLGCCSIYFL